MKRIAERQIQREDGDDPHSLDPEVQEEVKEVRVSLTARPGAPESPNSWSPEAPPRWPSCTSYICSDASHCVTFLKCIPKPYFALRRREPNFRKCTLFQDAVAIRKFEPDCGKHNCTPAAVTVLSCDPHPTIYSAFCKCQSHREGVCATEEHSDRASKPCANPVR